MSIFGHRILRASEEQAKARRVKRASGCGAGAVFRAADVGERFAAAGRSGDGDPSFVRTSGQAASGAVRVSPTAMTDG